jgi:hypothetical protein
MSGEPEEKGTASPESADGTTPKKFIIKADSAGSVKGELAILDPTRRAGLQLAIGVGIVISLAILAITYDWIKKSPWASFPDGLGLADPEKAKVIIENIRQINELATDRAVKMFDAIVGRSLLPLFTAILGYIFGTRSDK